MNKLSLLAVSLLTISSARAAGPRLVEPGAPQVKLDLAAPEAAALPAAAGALPEAPSLAAPASALPEAAAQALPAAAAQAAPAQAGAASEGDSVQSQQAALDHEFDGSVAKAADEDSISPEIDFGQGVSPAHRALFKEALAAHGDSLAGFFDLTGQPRPGFLYVSAAQDDSPGAAAVVTRVIYRVSAHSSRFDERVDAPFWIGVDTRSKKIEFFTKQPAGASPEAAAAAALQRRVADAFAALDARSFPGLSWSAEEPKDYAEIPLLREDYGDGYDYVALVPRGAAPDHFVIRRTGGLAGMTVYSSPVALVAPRADHPRDWPGHLVEASKRLSDYYRPLLGRATKILGIGQSIDHVIVLVEKPEDVAQVKADIEARFPDIAPLVEYQATGRIVAQGAAAAPANGDDPRITAATKAAVRAAFEERDRAGWPGVTWRKFPRIATQYARFHLSGSTFGDGYSYTALLPVWHAWMSGELDPNRAGEFFVQRSGGQTGETVYAGPFRFQTTPSGALRLAAAVEPARSGRMWTQDKLQEFVDAHETALHAVDGVLSMQVYELDGRPQLVVHLEPGVSEAAARAALEKAVPQITGLYGVLGAPSQLRFIPSPISGAMAGEIRRSFERLDRSSLKWHAAMPIGIRYARMTLHPIAFPEDYGYTALVPEGPLAPGADIDVSQARFYILAESGGQTGMTRYSQPIPLRGGAAAAAGLHAFVAGIPVPDTTQHVLIPAFVDLSKVTAGAIQWSRGDAGRFPGMANEVTATFFDAAGNTILFRFGDNEWAMDPGVTFIPPNLTEEQEHRIVGVTLTAGNAPQLAAFLSRLIDAAKPGAADAAAVAELRRRIEAFPAESTKLGQIRDRLIGSLIHPQVQRPFRVLGVKAGAYRVEVLVPTHDDAAKAEAFIRASYPDIAGLVWYSVAGPAELTGAQK